MLELANHTIKAIKERYGKDLKHWAAELHDRASTDKVALQSTNFWCSHTMNNTGKQMTEGKRSSCQICRGLQKEISKKIQHPGNAQKACDCSI